MNAFLNYSEFTKMIGQFKKKDICKFIHDMQFQDFFKLLDFNFCNYSLNTLLIKYLYILITSPRTHCRIISFIKKLNVIFY